MVPARAVDDALADLTNRVKLQQFLGPWSPDELMDLIERMNPAIEELPVDGDAMDEDPARIALPVLLDLLPRLPEDRGAFRPHGSMTLMRVTLRLLRRIPDESVRAAVVRGVFEDTRTLSSRLILLWVVGHRENVGTSLIDDAVAAELENELRNALMAQSPGDFAVQDRIGRLADLMAETEDGKVALRALAEDDRVMLSLLVDCTGETRGQTLGAAAVEVTKVLPWAGLAGWFGEERRHSDFRGGVRSAVPRCRLCDRQPTADSMGAAGAEAPGGGYCRARRGGRRGTGRRRGHRRGQRGGDTRPFAQWLGLRIRRSVRPFTVVIVRVLVTILDREKHSLPSSRKR